MNSTLYEWDGQERYALFDLGVSNRSDVTCNRVAREIEDRLATVGEIEKESVSISEKPIPRASEHVRLLNQIRDLTKLQRVKNC